jgi:hypothetical protein
MSDIWVGELVEPLKFGIILPKLAKMIMTAMTPTITAAIMVTIIPYNM